VFGASIYIDEQGEFTVTSPYQYTEEFVNLSISLSSSHVNTISDQVLSYINDAVIEETDIVATLYDAEVLLILKYEFIMAPIVIVHAHPLSSIDQSDANSLQDIYDAPDIPIPSTSLVTIFTYLVLSLPPNICLPSIAKQLSNNISQPESDHLSDAVAEFIAVTLLFFINDHSPIGVSNKSYTVPAAHVASINTLFTLIYAVATNEPILQKSFLFVELSQVSIVPHIQSTLVPQSHSIYA